MKLFGLIGFPLSHSFSKGYFAEKFLKEKIKDCKYELFPLEKITEFPSLIKKNENLKGLNVTIPYKEQVIRYIDKIDETAKKVGAVNTIKFISEKKSKKLVGYNTDVFGFEMTLKPLLESHHEKALILGHGGASKAVHYVLKKIGIECLFVELDGYKKKGDISWNEINENLISNHFLIINATPLGMYPKIDEFPKIPYNCITPKHLLYDLVYNPEKTKFLEFGEKQGATIQNGLQMLHLQAEKAWEIWNK
ncbi:MAG: shikimate dehydrogenase [Bacteroidales bacterium]|nr:shikimate dehydrogenase [Bacteroidales bacterium]